MLRRLRKPHIVLFFLSPFVVELMTGSAPPLEFFNPVGFLFIVTWYGCGVLLVREIAFRKQLDWKGILLLGMGFGILEEGIFVKTFFDPYAVDLDMFSTFGRYFGTNIPWAMYLTLFHALYSILFPIMLTYVFFKEDIKRPWLTRRGMTICGIILVIFSLFGWFFSDPSLSGTPYTPSAVHFVGCLAAIAVLAGISFRTGKPEYTFEKVTKKERRTLLLQGFIIGCLFSLGVFIVAALFMSTVILIGYVLITMGFIFFIKRRIKGNMPKFCYFIVANYFFLAFLGFLQEFNGLLGMSIVGIGFMVLFVKMVQYLNRQYLSSGSGTL